MMRASSAVQRTTLPGRAAFQSACRDGLSTLYPLGSRDVADPEGWRFGSAFPPSYKAFGRMRALLAVSQARALGPTRVLEVAAGGGGLSATLAAAGCSVTANDLRADLLATELAAYSSASRIQVVGGNLFELDPARLGVFDLVIACEVIEHVAHPDDLLRQLARLLTRSGRLLLTTPNGAHFRNRLPSFREAGDPTALEARQFQPDADGHLFLLHPEELEQLAHASGLVVDHLQLWGNPLVTGHAACRLLASAAMVDAAYAAEWLSQRLPRAWRARLCAQMSVVLSKASH